MQVAKEVLAKRNMKKAKLRKIQSDGGAKPASWERSKSTLKPARDMG